MSNYYIDPEFFAERMEAHWTDRLGNVTNNALSMVWKQLAQAFEENISGNHNAYNDKWIVVQPPTGSGKTQGAILYNALLASEIDRLEHPGSLVVTRLKEEADSISRQINELAGETVAIAHHSDSQTSWDELQNYPTLVITHKAYELALDYLGQDGTIGKTFTFFHKWNALHLERFLVIIDECLDIVEESQVSLDDLEFALYAVPLEYQKKFNKQYRALHMMHEKLKAQAMNKKVTKEMMLDPGEVIDMENVEMRRLRSAVKKVRLDKKFSRKYDNRENQRYQYFLDETLKAADVMLKTWIYFANHAGKYTWNTSKLLVPEDAKGAVVLDATASTNVVYELFNNAYVWSSPTGARDYRNVTLHVSIGHKIGKTDMQKDANKATKELISDLDKRLKGRDVLVVTHKDIEPTLKGYDPSFNLHTGHWGAIQGRNKWQDCDTIVIFGLPYKPNTCTANAYMALQEPKDTHWLNNPDDRNFKTHNDIRRSLKMGWLVTDIVQSFNRIRCRRVIDDRGNCPSAEGYIMFQDQSEAEEVLSILKREMPGINIRYDWHIETRKKRPKKSNYEKALSMLFETMTTGRMTKTDIAKKLGTSAATMDRLMSKVRDQESHLHQSMVDSGIQLIQEKQGRTYRNVFVKA